MALPFTSPASTVNDQDCIALYHKSVEAQTVSGPCLHELSRTATTLVTESEPLPGCTGEQRTSFIERHARSDTPDPRTRSNSLPAATRCLMTENSKRDGCALDHNGEENLYTDREDEGSSTSDDEFDTYANARADADPDRVCPHHIRSAIYGLADCGEMSCTLDKLHTWCSAPYILPPMRQLEEETIKPPATSRTQAAHIPASSCSGEENSTDFEGRFSIDECVSLSAEAKTQDGSRGTTVYANAGTDATDRMYWRYTTEAGDGGRTQPPDHLAASLSSPQPSNAEAQLPGTQAWSNTILTTTDLYALQSSLHGQMCTFQNGMQQALNNIRAEVRRVHDAVEEIRRRI